MLQTLVKLLADPSKTHYFIAVRLWSPPLHPLFLPCATWPLATIAGSIFLTRVLTNEKIVQLLPCDHLQELRGKLIDMVTYIEENYPKMSTIALIFTLAITPISSTVAIASALCYGVYTGIWIEDMRTKESHEDAKEKEVKAATAHKDRIFF